jgi:hypothetical protein
MIEIVGRGLFVRDDDMKMNLIVGAGLVL